MFGWRKARQKHANRDAAERHDEMSLMKMSRVGFSAPAKIRRSYRPARIEERRGLRVFIFFEEEIVPWPAAKR